MVFRTNWVIHINYSGVPYCRLELELVQPKVKPADDQSPVPPSLRKTLKRYLNKTPNTVTISFPKSSQNSYSMDLAFRMNEYIYISSNCVGLEGIYIYIHFLFSVHLMDVRNNSIVSFGKLELPTLLTSF